MRAVVAVGERAPGLDVRERARGARERVRDPALYAADVAADEHLNADRPAAPGNELGLPVGRRRQRGRSRGVLDDAAHPPGEHVGGELPPAE